ncbi:MAG: hypothetical protein AAGH89_08815 [Verrucomicrobiota bacterium]
MQSLIENAPSINPLSDETDAIMLGYWERLLTLDDGRFLHYQRILEERYDWIKFNPDWKRLIKEELARRTLQQLSNNALR